MKHTLEDINAEWEKDAEVDDTEPNKELVRIPRIQSKYLRAYGDLRLRIAASELKLKEMRRNKWKWFQGIMTQDELKALGWDQFQLKLKYKSDFGEYINNDPDVTRLQANKEYLETVKDVVERILKEINNRTYQVRSIIDYRKWTHDLDLRIK